MKWICTSNYEINRVEVPLQDWPQALDGLSLFLLADPHLDSDAPVAGFMEVMLNNFENYFLNQLNRGLVDREKTILCLLGDFTSYERLDPADLKLFHRFVELLGSIREQVLEAVAVHGNHDNQRKQTDGRSANWDYAKTLDDYNYTMLDGHNGQESTSLSVRVAGQVLNVIGLPDYQTVMQQDYKRPDISFPDNESPNLVLCHDQRSMDYLSVAQKKCVSFSASGNTHGGQGLPFVLHKWTQGLHSPEELMGLQLHHQGSAHYVSRGIGVNRRLGQPTFRLGNCRPEIAHIVLKTAPRVETIA